MNSFLQWFTGNNKLIIQALVVSISLVLIYFVYRIFFAKSEEVETVNATDTLVKVSESKEPTPVVSPIATPVVDEALKAENETHKKKIADLMAQLKQHQDQLTSKDEQLANMKEQLASKRPVPAISYVDPTQLSGDSNLVAQIDELQKKLKEYDIISDDIAELQDLRKENTALKTQLEGKSASS